MANQIVPVRYRSNGGIDFQTGVNSELTTQLIDGVGTDPKIGPGALVGVAGYPPLPSSVKPRRVYMKNPAGKGRYVICLDPTADLYVTEGATLTIEDSDGAPTTYTKVAGGERPERFGRSRA